ncbi:MAG: sugar ABC transporter ATP-binding protein [Geodermatophilaceae bacterium]
MLRAEGLSKSFGATRALQDVDLLVGFGERVVVVGENGAGKSTLMKVLAGVIRPDIGRMEFVGGEYAPTTPGDAISAGVAMVHQEPTVFPQLSALENVFMGRELRNRLGNLRWSAMRDEGRTLFRRLRLPTELLDRRMDTLSLGKQQLTLIARALHQDARLLILDEPTSILTDSEAQLLFSLIDDHVAAGGGVLYISHRMKEFPRVADRVVVLKDGRLVADMAAGDADEAAIIRHMSGRELRRYERTHGRTRGDSSLLSITGLSKAGVYEDVELDVHSGEIVGLYGLMGSGRTEVALTVFGVLQPDSGSMLLGGRPHRPGGPGEAVRSGVAYVPEDRKSLGLYPLMDCAANMSTAALPQLTRRQLIQRRQEQELVEKGNSSLAIKSRSSTESILNLSGGNQQKVLLARWLATNPRLLLLDEPTRGIDVGTKAEIHRLISAQADRGRAVLLISSELPELLALTDRIYVLYQGRVVAEVPGGPESEEAVITATMGSEKA